MYANRRNFRVIQEIWVEEHDGDVRFFTGSGNTTVSRMRNAPAIIIVTVRSLRMWLWADTIPRSTERISSRCNHMEAELAYLRPVNGIADRHFCDPRTCDSARMLLCGFSSHLVVVIISAVQVSGASLAQSLQQQSVMASHTPNQTPRRYIQLHLYADRNVGEPHAVSICGISVNTRKGDETAPPPKRPEALDSEFCEMQRENVNVRWKWLGDVTDA